LKRTTYDLFYYLPEPLKIWDLAVEVDRSSYFGL